MWVIVHTNVPTHPPSTRKMSIHYGSNPFKTDPLQPRSERFSFQLLKMKGGINDDDYNYDTEECARTAQELIPLVISEACSTKVFAGKWQTITTKLKVLNLTITSVTTEPSCSWADNSLMKELLPKIVSTLKEARDHAKKCRELSYSGKLLMQSDLDVVVNKLNLHQRDLEVLVKSGVLRESSSAIVVSRPGPGASRDDVSFFMKDLFARLQIGNTQLKEKALISLVQILQENDKDIVRDEGLDIGYLVHLLDSNIATIREYSVLAVSILAKSDACKACLVGEGVNVIAPLIRLLESGTSVASEKAAEALLGLTVVSWEVNHIDRENAWAVSAYGGLSPLIKICRNGSSELQAFGSAVLRNLAYVEHIRGPMAEEGAIPVLINLVQSGTPPAQESSAECLHLLAANHENLRQIICREGGVESLVRMLEKAPNTHVQEIALRTIHSLSQSIFSRNLLMSSGFVKQLTVLLKSGSSAIQELAVSAICNLSQTDEIKRALGEAGCVGLLAQMLDGKPSFSQQLAVRALSSLFVVDTNRKEFIKNDDHVSCLVRLLDPQNETVTKTFPISALLALSYSNSCRKRIVSAGARQHLKMLAEMEVVGAKKTLRKLAGSRLRKIFSARW